MQCHILRQIARHFLVGGTGEWKPHRSWDNLPHVRLSRKLCTQKTEETTAKSWDTLEAKEILKISCKSEYVFWLLQGVEGHRKSTEDLRGVEHKLGESHWLIIMFWKYFRKPDEKFQIRGTCVKRQITAQKETGPSETDLSWRVS